MYYVLYTIYYKLCTKRKRGFTLLEVLIAVVLFTVGAVVIIGLFGRGFAGSLNIEKDTVAANLAQQKMEEIRNLALGSIADEAKADVADFAGFQMQVEEDTIETNLKQVTVTVYWTSKGNEISVPLTTYITSD